MKKWGSNKNWSVLDFLFSYTPSFISAIGLSYGSLKNNASIEMPDIYEICEESNYRLPENEIAAKYVSIALYSAMFRLDILEQLLGNDPESYYSDELTFLREKGLIDQDGSRITLTPEGFRYYGAVAALFWSNEQKAYPRIVKSLIFPDISSSSSKIRYVLDFDKFS